VLAKKVQTLDIDSLHTQQFAFDHLPAHDEIQIVSHALDEMTTKVHDQVVRIKQFVANVSHEFKTPLMSLQSTLEVGEKTNNYTDVLLQTRDQIGVMSRLLDTLTILTNAQHTTALQKQEINLEGTIVPLVMSMQEKYPDVQFTHTIDPHASVFTQQ
jgi:signal transduction histidine kinase